MSSSFALPFTCLDPGCRQHEHFIAMNQRYHPIEMLPWHTQKP
jgi:hypothetical protein